MRGINWQFHCRMCVSVLIVLVGRARMLWSYSTVVAIAIGLATTDATAQPARSVVGPTPACAECRIELQRVVQLGSATDSVLLYGQFISVSRTSRNEYIVGPSTNSTLALYSGTGRLLRTIGRAGSGPGEFQTPIMVHAVSPGDSLYVLDYLPKTLNVFSPRFDFARAQFLRAASREAIIPLPQGQLLMGVQLGTPNERGYPIHLLSRDGEFVKSFGSTTRVRVPELPVASVRRFAVAPDQRVWSSHINEYVIEQWSLQGNHLQTIERKAEWFEPWDGASLRDVGMYHPNPAVRGLNVDSAGLLLVSVQVPKAAWRRRDDSSRVVTPLTERRQYVETVIDAIDPGSGGRLLASLRVDDVLYPLGQNYFWSCRGDDSGRIFIDIWKATVRR